MPKTYKEVIAEAEKSQTAIGHFNISNIEGLWGIFQAAKELSVPVIIGLSEGERKFIGLKQARALVTSLRDEFDWPIFLNADHTYTFDGIKAAVDAGYDSVIFDGSKLPLDENIKITKQCVAYAREKGTGVLVEGEIGYIGTSSKILEAIPDDVAVAGEALTTSALAKQFVTETGVDLLAPAVGNLHGMLKNTHNPDLDIKRITAIRQAAEVPLVLHGGSGITDNDFRQAIKAGIAIVHINTEIRVAYRNALKKSLQANPDEVAPYKIMKESVKTVEKKVRERLELFSNR